MKLPKAKNILGFLEGIFLSKNKKKETMSLK